MKQSGYLKRQADVQDRLLQIGTEVGQQQVNDESIRDTLIDLANYAIMTVLEMEVAKDVAD